MYLKTTPEALPKGERRYGSDPLFFKRPVPKNEVSDPKIDVSEPKKWELFLLFFAFKYMSDSKSGFFCYSVHVSGPGPNH